MKMIVAINEIVENMNSSTVNVKLRKQTKKLEIEKC